jgi:hypothetical protein
MMREKAAQSRENQKALETQRTRKQRREIRSSGIDPAIGMNIYH